ncbi:MAG: efflux RND transporter permease subunit [Planctomycetota bacterium]|nr:efflux RND transporter permease subunit [Planctomycetota bacterium]
MKDELRGVIPWFVRNRVAANVLMVAIMAGGAMTIPKLTYEVFPEFSPDIVSVSVPYPGAAPEEVERSICKRIEEELDGLPGVDRVSSIAAEGAGTVSVELLRGANLRDVLSDVKARVDAITSFPTDAEKPIVSEFVPRAQVINVAVYGQAEERSLKRLAERTRDELLAIDGITQVVMTVARPDEISLELEEAAMQRHGLTFDEVTAAVRRSSLDLPGGAVRTEGGEVLLRTVGQAYEGDEFAALPIRSRPDGTRLVLGDVARVDDGFAETDQAAHFDGLPGVILQVFRVGDQNALKIGRDVADYVALAEQRLPDGVELTTWRDDSRMLRGRLQTLVKNGWQGLLLVFLVLTLFLRFKLSFWVTLGIPLSFLGTFLLMPVLGLSINLLSLFAFLIVLGIVVDDAIVVGESVFQRIQRGETGELAAIRGTRDVAVPVTFAVLTSVAAFAPMAGLDGLTGKIWRVIPLVVIPTLLFSLVESKLILPAHLVHASAEPASSRIGRLWGRFQGLFSGGLERFAEVVYRPVAALCLRNRYLTVAAAVGVVLLTGGMALGGVLKFSFFPKLPADDIACQVTMPLGTPASVTRQAVATIEAAAKLVADEVEAEYGARPILHMLASVGEQPWRAAQRQIAGGVSRNPTGGHLGEVHIALVPSEERVGPEPDELVRRWREKAGAIPGAEEMSFTAELMGAGAAIDVQLSAENVDALERAAEELKQTLAGYPGVYDVSDSFRAGKREFVLSLLPEAEASGLTLADLGRQVRQAFFGEEVQRVQRGQEEVKVMLRFPAETRRSLESLETMRVRLPGGREVPFQTVARADDGRAYPTINRTGGRRTLNVTAEVDAQQGDANDVRSSLTGEVLPALVLAHPQVSWSFEGEQKEQAETLSSLLSNFVLALLAIYALMAIPFRSYLQPLIVMTAIPFGMVGAFLGHWLVGMDLNVLSMCGMIALAGVVVNDNLVLVDAINRVRRNGVPILVAVREAGVNRFRPILLTSLTTFAGLTPLMLEPSLQARFMIPMAISLAFGVLFATAVSLLLVPCLYLVLDDLHAAARWVLGRDTTSPPEGVVEGISA